MKGWHTLYWSFSRPSLKETPILSPHIESSLESSGVIGDIHPNVTEEVVVLLAMDEITTFLSSVLMIFMFSDVHAVSFPSTCTD